MDVKSKVRVKLEDLGPEMLEVKVEDVKPKVEDVKPKLEDDIEGVKPVPLKIEDVSITRVPLSSKYSGSRTNFTWLARRSKSSRKIKEIVVPRILLKTLLTLSKGDMKVKQEVFDISDDDELSTPRARNQELVIEVSDDDDGPVVSEDDRRLTVPKRRKLEGDPEAKPRIKLEPDSSSAQEVALLAAVDKAHGPGLPIPRFKEEYIDNFNRVPPLADPTSDVRRSTMLKRRKLEEESEEKPKIKLGPALSSVPDAIVLGAEEKPHGGTSSPALAVMIPRLKKEYIDTSANVALARLDPLRSAPSLLKRRRSTSPLSALNVGRSEQQSQAVAEGEDVSMPLANAGIITTSSAKRKRRRMKQGTAALGNEIEEGEIPETPVTPVPRYPPRKFIEWRFNTQRRDFTIFKYEFPGRRVLFATPVAHPSMPDKPRASGSLYTLAAEIPEGPFTIFRNRTTSTESGCEYLGEYIHELVGPMIPELYSANGNSFQEKWADDIRRDSALPELRRIRARIALRKAGTPITAAAVDTEITTGSPQLVSTEEVIQAFKSGEESSSLTWRLPIRNGDWP
ncbi:hypothetical protein C8R46DRAFT_1196656 [Mycena filopes]|nr:hypothetical protein C8R46DRAFT_1196656 [Mycena filopes]